MARKPELQFGPGASSGFTPTGIAAFDNLRPAAVVRELIQNALDAARAARVRRARVRFQLTRVPRDAIPGMENYEQTFAKAIETQREMSQGSLARQAEIVVERIQGALDQDEVDVLTVYDNGIGLDESRMNALLSDGVSIKDSAATGTYGNGHATAIPVSDLRYVLYAGITAGLKRIGSGHAVLASHYAKGHKHLRGGDGFFIRDFRAGQGSLFDYSRGPGLSGVISQALAEIKRETAHGTAVIIPAFNNFLEDQSLWNMVAHAASANFFVALEERRLEVTVTDRRPDSNVVSRTLNRSTLSEVLEQHADKKRAAAFLNGQRAFEAHSAYRSGARHSIDTRAGRVRVRLTESASGNTRIDLCRNGMWITDDSKLPGFYQRFADRVPFHAVITLDAREGRRLHEYIREAEGPLHDSIALKRLSPEDQKACRKALGEIRHWLRRNTSSVQTDSYVPDDFLTLDFGDEPGTGGGKPTASYWGVPVSIARNPVRELPVFPIKRGPDRPDPPDPKPFNPSQHRRRPTLPAHFQVVSRPAGKNRQRIIVESTRDFQDAELRLVVDEALDATCERHGQDVYTPAALSDVRIDGKKAPKSALRRANGSVLGVRIGRLKPGTAVRIEATYRFTGDFSDLPNPSLRVEVCRTDRGEDTPAPTTSGDPA